MRKILLLLLLPVVLWAANGFDSATASGKWYGATQATWSLGAGPGPLDTAVHVAAINDTCDIDTTIGANKIPPVNGTRWWINRTMHINKWFYDSGTGTGHYGTNIHFDSAGSTFRVSSGVGVRTSLQLNLYFNLQGPSTFTDSKGITIKSLNLAAKDTLTINGAGATIIGNTTNMLIMGNGSKLIHNASPPKLLPTTTQSIWSIGTGCVITGTSGAFVIYGNAAGALTFTVPAFPIYLTASIASMDLTNYYTGQVFSLSGDYGLTGNIGSLRFHSQVGGHGKSFFYVNGNNIYVYSFKTGAANATDTNIVSCGSGQSWIINDWEGNAYNTGVMIDSLKTVQIRCLRNWAFGSNHTIIPGTSRIVMCPTATARYTNNGKSFYDLFDSAANAFTIYHTDSIRVTHDLIIIVAVDSVMFSKGVQVGNDLNIAATANVYWSEDLKFTDGGSHNRHHIYANGGFRTWPKLAKNNVRDTISWEN